MNFRLKLTIFTLLFMISSCTKEVPPELQNKQKTAEQQKMPDDSIHRKFAGNKDRNSEIDKKSETDPHSSNNGSGNQYTDKVIITADNADLKYQKTKSESDKIECIDIQLAAANYLMFEADLPPKEKYKPALIRYRRVLELDPQNAEAIQNKGQIEEIYVSMGLPIPK
mgnify:CR=1 FL=1